MHDRVHDMLLQNMANWHIDYFKLKEFERQHVRKDLSDLPLTFSPGTGHKTLMWECPSYTQKNGMFLSLKTQGHRAESKQKGLSITNLLASDHPLCPFTFLHHSRFFIKPAIQNTQVWLFIQVFISLCRFLCHIELISNKLACFLLVNLSFDIDPSASNLG